MNILKMVNDGAHFIKIQRFGKIPIEKWKDVDPPSANTVSDWIEDDYNLAVKTGIDFFVVDIDEKSLMKDFAVQYDIHETFTVSTPRGYHLYFNMPDFEIKNAVGILPKIDVRGKGGIVITPPSVIRKDSVEYHYCSYEHERVDAPPLLLDLLRPKPRPEPKPFSYNGDIRKYEKAALESEVNKILQAGDGERNDTLVRAAFNLATISSMNEGIIRAKLTIAGMDVGLPESEILNTLNSGIVSGRCNLR